MGVGEVCEDIRQQAMSGRLQGRGKTCETGNNEIRTMATASAATTTTICNQVFNLCRPWLPVATSTPQVKQSLGLPDLPSAPLKRTREGCEGEVGAESEGARTERGQAGNRERGGERGDEAPCFLPSRSAMRRPRRKRNVSIRVEAQCFLLVASAILPPRRKRNASYSSEAQCIRSIEAQCFVLVGSAIIYPERNRNVSSLSEARCFLLVGSASLRPRRKRKASSSSEAH